MTVPKGAVDLTGGVTITDSDLARVIEQAVNEDDGSRATFEFQFNRQGRITSCRHHGVPTYSTRRVLPVESQNQVCEHLTRFGSIVPDTRLAVSFDLGYAAMSLLANWEWHPAKPITFVKTSAGIAVDLRYNPSNGACWVQSSGISRDAEVAICQAWQATGRPGTPIQLNGGKTRSYRLKVAAQPVARRVALHWSDEIANEYQPAAWLVAQPSPDRMIAAPLENPRILLSEEDYPVPALRSALQSRVIALVRFGLDGKPDFCAPISSSNTAYMGNATCMFLLGRTMLPAGKDKSLYVGKHYKAVIVWQLPK